MTSRRKFFIKTFGCQMNVYDTGRMGDLLGTMGCGRTYDMENADVIVLNTCNIREKAAEKIYSELGRIREVRQSRRKAGKKTLVCVAGCVAQAEGEEIISRAPVVDIVVGPQSYHNLPAMILTVRQEGCRIVDTGFASDEKFQKLPPVKPQGSSTAFLTIQEGCDKFCTFCVVPYTRGSEFSRPMAKLLEEAQVMAEMGVREITLLGQNVNAYHGKDESGHERGLAYLLARIGEIDGVERLRFTTSHPRDMDDELIAAFKNNPKLMPYLHLPLQSGSDSILSAMNRRHTVSQYLDLVDEIRSVRPDIAISTDIIVGFPGETKEDFSRTMEVVRQVRFAQAYSFKYSPRPGTPAAETEDQVDEMLKSARLQELQELLNRQQEAFNSSCVGRTLSVLFEKPGRRPGQIVGRSPYLQPVHVEGDDALQGTIANVRISASGPNSLSGINV